MEIFIGGLCFLSHLITKCFQIYNYKNYLINTQNFLMSAVKKNYKSKIRFKKTYVLSFVKRCRHNCELTLISSQDNRYLP